MFINMFYVLLTDKLSRQILNMNFFNVYLFITHDLSFVSVNNHGNKINISYSLHGNTQNLELMKMTFNLPPKDITQECL